MTHSIRLIQVGAATAVIVALAGCDSQNLLVDPVQIRISGGDLQVRACEQISATRILVQTRLEGGWDDIWSATGDVDLAAGQVLSTSGLAETFPDAQKTDNPAGEVGEEVVVLIYGVSENLSSSFKLNEPAIEGSWIDPEGESSKECAA